MKTLKLKVVVLKCLRHSHNEAIGEVKERNPWSEDVYRLGKFYLVHWQNYKHEPWSSAPTPRHTWRLHNTKSTTMLMLQYGIAPMNEPE